MIEFVGLPGSGKTTVSTKMTRRLRRRGVNIIGAGRNARELASSTPRYVRDHEDRIALFHALEFRRLYPTFCNIAAKSFPKSDPSHDFRFHIVGGAYAAWKKFPMSSDHIFLDEGFTQMGVPAYIDLPDKDFETYLSLVPIPSQLIYINIPTDVAYQRGLDRLPHQTQRFIDKFGDLAAFEKRAARIRQAVEKCLARGVHCIEVDGTHDVKSVADEIIECLE